MSRIWRTGLPTILAVLIGCPGQPAGVAADTQLEVGETIVDSTPPKTTDDAAPSRVRSGIWDFGILPPGLEARHRFTIANWSADTWTIQNVTKSCSCTAGQFSKRTLKPADSSSVEVTLRTPKDEGKVEQMVMVEFKERQAPLFYLVIRGEIRNALSALPSSIDFGRIGASARSSRTLELRNYSDQDISLTKIESPEWVEIEQQLIDSKEQSPRPRQAWKLVLHAVASKLKTGTTVATLTIRTDSGKSGALEVPLRLHVKSPIEVVPGELSLGTLEPGKIGQQTLLVEVASYLGDLTEKDLVLGHNLGSELEVHLSKGQSSNRFLLVSRFQSKQSRGPVEGELEIRTRGGEVSPVRVKVSANVKP